MGVRLNIEEKIKEVQNRIKRNERVLETLNDNIVKAYSPKGIKGNTSYNDYDTIRGSKKEVSIFSYAEDKKRLEAFILIDKAILENLIENKDLEERLYLLKNNGDRALFLKNIGYKNVEIAEMLQLTEVHISRLLSQKRKNYKKGNVKKNVNEI